MLLTELYPRSHHFYSSLPVLGSMLAGYARWVSDQGYPKHRVRMHLRTARHLVSLLHDRSVHTLENLTREQLRACAPASSQDDPELAVLVRLLDRYLESEGVFPAPPPTAIETRLTAYRAYLKDVRGLAFSTVTQHIATIAEFLDHLDHEKPLASLSGLTEADVEGFVRKVGQRLSRASFQHTIAHIRAFFLFLQASNEIPTYLQLQIDTPRVYREEQLPRTLPWDTVIALLHSIDRSTPMGRRDYAMLLLISTYGLRACEVVTLTLDDIDWRIRQFRLPQHKTANRVILPLTDEVGGSLVNYLQQGRPRSTYREVFLRCRAPEGVLKPTAVCDVFQAWSRKRVVSPIS